MTKKLTGAIYDRLSSPGQEDGMSREVQEEKCREYCEKNNIEVAKVYYENRSGMTPYDRPIFNEMLANQQTKNKVDCIIAYCVNRLMRNHVDYYQVERVVDKYNTKIIFVKENIVIQKPMKAHETFLMDIIIAQAKFEVNHMNEIRRNGLIAKAKTGIRPSKLNYGYKWYKGSPVIIPERANFVKKAYEMYATEKYSLSQLPKALYDNGYKYRLQKNGLIPKSTLEKMLKSIYYTGKYDYPGCEKRIDGKHKAIINIELFNEVQRILSKSGYEKLKKHDFLYAKLIQFKETGSIMTGDIKKGKYIYYTALNKNGKYCCVNENIITNNLIERFKLLKLNMIPKNLIKRVFINKTASITQEIKTLKCSRSKNIIQNLIYKTLLKKMKLLMMIL